MMELVVYTDGGARGNPGPAGIGAVIREGRGEGETIQEISEYIGEATNNQAEYRALIAALEWILKQVQDDIGVEEIECLLDSELVVKQLNDEYKMKNEGLKPLFGKARDLVMELGGKVSFRYIPREQNKRADELVNRAIDRALKG